MFIFLWDKNCGDFGDFPSYSTFFYHKFLYCLFSMLHQMSYQKIISWSSRFHFLCFISLMLCSIFVFNQTPTIFLDPLLPSWYITFIVSLRLSSCFLIKRCYSLLKSFVPVIGLLLDLSYCTFYVVNNLHFVNMFFWYLCKSTSYRWFFFFFLIFNDFLNFDFLSIALTFFNFLGMIGWLPAKQLHHSNLSFLLTCPYTKDCMLSSFVENQALSVSLINLSQPSSLPLMSFQIVIRKFLLMFTFGILFYIEPLIYIDIQWNF